MFPPLKSDLSFLLAKSLLKFGYSREGSCWVLQVNIGELGDLYTGTFKGSRRGLAQVAAPRLLHQLMQSLGETPQGLKARRLMATKGGLGRAAGLTYWLP
mmetsp:Transcript_14216/g.33847  ORF Transcript_14216/g.33847 Transcript_14216/m.33847 type:complete len:100 (-) Transcript_14216:102-401(-)